MSQNLQCGPFCPRKTFAGIRSMEFGKHVRITTRIDVWWLRNSIHKGNSMRLKWLFCLLSVLLLLSGQISCGRSGSGSGSGDDDNDITSSGAGDNDITYMLTYHANAGDSGDVPEDPTNYYEGDSATVQGNTGSLINAGYTFEGWNTRADGTGTSYQAGDLLTLADSDVVLYAKWISLMAPVVHYKFDSEDGTDGTMIIDHGLAGADAYVVGSTGMTRATDETGALGAFRATGGGTNQITVSQTDMADKVNPFITDEITVVFKAKMDGYNSNYDSPNTYVNLSNLTGTRFIRFELGVRDSNDFKYTLFTAVNAAERHLDYGTNLTDNIWRQYAITYKDHTLKFFIDGVQYDLRYGPTGTLPDFNGAMELMKMDDSRADQTGCISDFRIYNFALKSAQLRALNDNLVAYYPMDDNSADADPELILTAFGNFDGTTTETIPEPDRFELPEYSNATGAMDFDGLSAYMEIPNLNDHMGTVFSISAWAKTDSAHGIWAIISSRNSTAIEGFMLGTHDDHPGQWLFQVNNGSWSSTNPNIHAEIDTTKWHHVVGTYDGTTANLYVDGVLAGSVSVSDFQPASEPIFIGKRNQSDVPFDGKIDDVRFYAKALSADDVLRIYEDGRYVRGYVDCAYPYDDCNPTLHNVKSALENIADRQTEAHGCFNPDTPADGFFFGVWDHYQGAAKFLPPRGDRIVFSRSDSDQSNIVFDVAPYSGTCSGADALDEWAYDPDSIYRHHHAGGIQSIGRFMIAAMDDNGFGWTPDPDPSHFHTVFYDADNIGFEPYDRNLDRPSLICYEGSVPRNTGLGFLAWSSIGKVRSGKYIWTNGYYSGTNFYRLKTYMTRSDDLTDLGSGRACLDSQFDYVLEIDLNNQFIGDHLGKWGTCDHDNCNEAGEYQNGFYLNQANGDIFLLLSSFGAGGGANHGYPVLFELKIDKMRTTDKYGELIWVYGDLTASTRVENDHGDFKAGVDYHINENGELVVIASDLNAPNGYNVDYDIITAD